MKSIISLVCIVLVACALRGAQARPKRSVLLAASPVVASVPVVQTVSHVHHNPTTVVKTEQVSSGDHASYSYSTEVKTAPVVHTHAAVAAAPVAAVSTVHHHAVPTVHHAVPTVHHAVPTYGYGYGYYPAVHSYYSPYHYVVGK